ncbi:hypothetical protein KFE25_010002 [Diacronema lutheri]|uniref:Uncharacterized protein n=1 Tax=Diacronema lutheri TaxID=2081491 RepID=A0A8J6C9J4_DIALT|nr:hypothetical protein KFE25_010002 [Diacronema lutheri]
MRPAALALLALAARFESTSDKVFFIGPNKTGTSTLMTLFRRWGYRACHGVCGGGMRWGEISRAHDRSSRVFSQFAAFMDNGDEADFKWLAGCAPFGNATSCARAYSDFVANDATAIRAWVVALAQHQDAAVAHFSTSHELMQRFAVVDVERQAGAELRALLGWSTRRRLEARQTQRLVLTLADVPHELTVATPRLPPAGAGVPHINAHGSADATTALVERVLRSTGCNASMWDDLWYRRCADAITREGAAKGRKSK